MCPTSLTPLNLPDNICAWLTQMKSWGSIFLSQVQALTLQQWSMLFLGLLLIMDISAIIIILYNKQKLNREESQSKWTADFIVNRLDNTPLEELFTIFRRPRNQWILLNQYIELRQNIRIRSLLQNKIHSLFTHFKITVRLTKRLCSYRKFRRIDAAVSLGHLGSDDARIALQNRLTNEKNWLVRMYIVNALTEINHKDSIPGIVETLKNAPDWYFKRATSFLTDFGHQLYEYIPQLLKHQDKSIRLLIIQFAHSYIAGDLHKYLLKTIKDDDIELVRASANALASQYPGSLDIDYCLSHPDQIMKEAAIIAMEKRAGKAPLSQLIQLSTIPELSHHVVRALTTVISSHPYQIHSLVKYYNQSNNKDERQRIIQVLANKAEFFILNLLSENGAESSIILQAMLQEGFINTILGFLSRNKNIEFENALLTVIKKSISDSPELETTLRSYLPERLLGKLKLEPLIAEPKKKHSGKAIINRMLLVVMLVGSVLIFPGVFLLLHHSDVFNMSLSVALKRYVLDCNYYLIFYTVSISSIYLFLLFLSAIDSMKQRAYASVKKRSFLFRNKLLPSISIIAPAYNEELTVIESANSLLNIRYPEFEVLVVNDGSSDKTLHTLIDYFDLEKVDMVITPHITTNPIRGIYRNKAMPRLTVVDKANGGKADSLNAGINLSRMEYFCGIDADSLLEEDALLKLVSTSLDVDKETVAAGGNIFPVNGCQVSHGVLEKTGVPQSHLANLQFIEYIRAFMAGRIGWAKLNCLLIISGAFGLFSKKRIIECGGYLTAGGKYGHDTVGEDMELVVRVSRHMREAHLPYQITYSYNANCWTEVPEKSKILFRQRDRWHRGLIEILTFHRGMFFNPRYGRLGLIATPYFYFFEMMGPLVEANGYLMVVLSAVLGILNPPMVLMLFVATVMLGVFISIAALIIAEQEVSYFRFREVLKLISYAIIENFGFRQMMSLYRVVAFINVIKGTSGWGKMERTGFAGSKKK
ncbi:MAG: glycosyltransferase [Fibrobacteria bacterium]|nr:glycosyltransferase [Fibrobacteria bacterium]